MTKTITALTWACYTPKRHTDLLRVWFKDGVFGVGGSNGANYGLTKFNMYVGVNEE